jgi:ABC-type sugar transport system permease subunit
MSTFIYRQSITLANVGYGASASMVLLVLAVGLSVLFSRAAGRTEAQNV